MPFETIFTMDTSSIKFGKGAIRELGYEMGRFDARRVLVLTDPNLRDHEIVASALQSLTASGIEAVLYDRVRVEPTDVSMQDAIACAVDGRFDGYVAVGGGSTMDTAKAANLYATWPADFPEYVAPPIGRGAPVPGPLKPMIAIPTTAGTGSETTAVAIFDDTAQHAKTALLHRYLRPHLAIIDPDATRTLPAVTVASCGFDILSHAIESMTILPFHQRPAPENPAVRAPHQGANPISDIWAARAIELVSQNMLRVLEQPEDDEARGRMLLAAAFAGIGFGNAGVHLPHGMSYAVAGLVRDYIPAGFVSRHPIVPHGMSVILNAPAVFRFTAPSNPELHLRAAALMGVDIAGAALEDAGDILSRAVVDLMRKSGMPNGLRAIGYSEADIEALVAGTLPQQRIIQYAPRKADVDDLKRLFRESLTLW